MPDECNWQIEFAEPARRGLPGVPRHISILLVKCVGVMRGSVFRVR